MLQFVIMIVSQFIFLDIKSAPHGRRYDDKLAEIINRLEQNVDEKQRHFIQSKLSKAEVISHDNTLGNVRNNILNNPFNESSQQTRFVYNPHPAKLPNKEMTDEERSITTRTQDLQAERQKVLKAVCDNHTELHNLRSYERMDYVLTDKDNRLIYAMIPKVILQLLQTDKYSF